MSSLQYANPYHAYVFGTSFWYFLRGIVRVIDPAAVIGWFRPPSQWAEPNDLELYTTRVDAFGLLTLAGILLITADAIALPNSYVGSTLVSSSTSTNNNDGAHKSSASALNASKAPYARAVVFITVLHHIATGLGSYTHYRLESHYTAAMSIGVWGNIAFAGLGVAALVFSELNENRPKFASSVGNIEEKEKEVVQRAKQTLEEVNVGGHSLRKRA